MENLMKWNKFRKHFYSICLIFGLLFGTEVPIIQTARSSFSTIQLSVPVLTLDPVRITSYQVPNEIVTKTLTVGNEGEAELVWSVHEDPLVRQPLPLPIRPVSPLQTSPNTVITGDSALPQSFYTEGRAVSDIKVDLPEHFLNQATITHSISQTIMPGNFISCSYDGGATTKENGFLRTFFLEDFDISGNFVISEVSFGIEGINLEPIEITVNLYTLNTLPFTYSNMTLIGSESVILTIQALTVVNIPINATAPAGSTLVVEVDVPDTSGTAAFYMGANDLGQTAPSYWRSASCGLAQPTSFANIGYPNVHIVINVTGEPEPPACNAPSGVDWVDVVPTSGAVSPDDSQVVSLTFDSTGMEIGSYFATLCLESNDPARPLATVPLTLEVAEYPAIALSPAAFDFLIPGGEQDEDILTISNVGTGNLIWSIEAEDAGPEIGLFTSFVQSFDDINTLIPAGWFMQNNSEPSGASSWFQGNSGIFYSHQGALNSYISADVFNTSGSGTISNWILTPPLELKDGDTVSFYTRAKPGSLWPDRLEVRMSLSGASTYVGNTATSVGDFTTLLFSVNSDLIQGGYPEVWTQVNIVLDGIGSPTLGRLAFRYYVTDAGPNGNNSDYIGIDTFEYISYTQMICSNPGEVDWVNIAPSSGTTPAGGSDYVTLTVDANGLTPGETYEANLCVYSNDLSLPMEVVPVSVEVGEKVIAGFSFSPSLPAVGQEVEFINLTTGLEPIEFLWDFGDETKSTDKDPIHIYEAEGIYEVTLTASNTFGVDAYHTTVTVQLLPTSPWLTLDLSVEPDPVILNQPATFTALVKNISDKTVKDVIASGIIPDFVTFVAATDECSVEGDVLTCYLGDFRPGEGATARVTVIFASTGAFNFSMGAEGVGATLVSGTANVKVVTRLYAPILIRSK
jgi:PKD repeat protein